MLANQEASGEQVDTPPMKEEDLINIMVAFGVNSLIRRYDSESQDMYHSYLNLPLHFISGSWDHLDDHVKIAVVNSNIDSFSEWVAGGRYER